MEKANTINIEASIERIAYHSDESGFSIIKVKAGDPCDPITVVGTMVNPIEGEAVGILGEWTNHPKYGRQLKILSYQTKAPVTTEGIERYLASGLIKGIGPMMAKRMVGFFGPNALEIIENSPNRLDEIPGIGPKRAETIKKAWVDQREIRHIMVFLYQYGVGSTFAVRIYKKYGSDSIKIIQQNPYQLATDIHGIGFERVDAIALKMGFSKESEYRIESGVRFVLQKLSGQGHVCYPYFELIQKAAEVLGVGSDLIKSGVCRSQASESVVVDDAFESQPVYLKKFHVQETDLAKRVSDLFTAARTARLPNTHFATLLESEQKKMGISLAHSQRKAVEMVLSEKVSIISGGPGTGKTTLVKAILTIFMAARAKILLAAPTGRAAKRMTEATGYEAKTIHRLLLFQQGAFLYDKDNPLECDLIIIDEASMIDLSLMQHLVDAIPMGAVLVLVGDIYQLPSVGAGNVLKDFIDAKKIPVMILTEIFRQAHASKIISNAHKINNGVMPEIRNGASDDFFFQAEEDPENILSTVVELVKDRIPGRFGYNPVNDIQVLTPMHKGIIGTSNLNVRLQEVLNPYKGESNQILRGGKVFREGDKVLHTKNNYDLDVFNGDVGRIDRIDTESGQVIIDYDGREVVYEADTIDEITLAYAMSVHKAQGSEYPVLVMPVSTQHYIMLQRNLIYTGVTRGKKLVVLVGQKKALAMAVNNNKTMRRHSFLKERLVENLKSKLAGKGFF